MVRPDPLRADSVRPDRDSYRELARRGAPVPLVREVLADLDTPLAIFRKLDDGSHAFLFESVEGGEKWGRYSIIGLGAGLVFRSRGARVEIRRGERTETIELPADRSVDPLVHLRRLLAERRPLEIPELPRFVGGAVGYVAYDWVRFVERLPDSNPDDLELPDCFFVFPETVLVHDRLAQRLSIVHLPGIEAGADPDAARERGCAAIERVVERLARPLPAEAPLDARVSAPALDIRSNTTREQYAKMVERAREYIRAGDVFQVVPSQRLTVPLGVDPLLVYRWLRVINPSPYMFFLRCDDHLVLGASPEILVRLDAGEVTLRPIAGTYRRGADEAEDRALERQLLADPKELAEHVMLVDLGRNDVGRVAEIGSVRVNEFQVIERYSHVMHIVSNVVGRLRPGLDAVDLLRACFPAGTVSGAPKVRAMEIIDELESTRRGLYGGAVGYLDARGNMDVCIAIRTLLAKDGLVHVQAGGGVVADSDPDREYEESLHKARALLRAIECAAGSSR
jgi:anthranilate synthase component 1